MLRHEAHPRKRQRLHLLFLLASQQVRSRSQLSRVLGIARNTVASWLATYQTGGIDALLALYIPAGGDPALAPPQLEQLRARLAEPRGFGSYGEVQQWIEETFGSKSRASATKKS